MDDATGQGQKQTVAFITPSGSGTSGRKELNSEQNSGMSKPETETSPRLQPPPTLPPQPVFDSKLVDDFLAGEYCLNGVKKESIEFSYLLLGCSNSNVKY